MQCCVNAELYLISSNRGYAVYKFAIASLEVAANESLVQLFEVMYITTYMWLILVVEKKIYY